MKLSKRGKLLLLFLVGTPVALLLASFIYFTIFVYYGAPARIAGYFYQNATDDTDTSTPLCQPIKVPLIAPEARVLQFDQIKVDFAPDGESNSLDDYPRRPYTVEISGNGKIRFMNEIIPQGAEGQLAPEQIPTLLEAINAANFPYIANISPPKVDHTHPQRIAVSLTLNGIEQTESVVGCNWHEEMYKLIAAVKTASTDFVEESFTKAANAGSFDAQMQLASHYTPGGQPHQSFQDAFFWASIAEKTIESSKNEQEWKREWAIKNRIRFENSISAEQGAQVKKRLEEWYATGTK